jgi:DinB family protein
MSDAKVEVFAGVLEICKIETERVAGEVREEDRLLQLREGKAHPLWLIGHLANSTDLLGLSWALGIGPMLPEDYRKRFSPDFAGGLPVTIQAEDYPSWEEALDAYRRVFDRFLEGVRNVRDEDLDEKPRAPVPVGFEKLFSSVGACLRIMVMHDNYHRGQLGMLSKLRV